MRCSNCASKRDRKGAGAQNKLRKSCGAWRHRRLRRDPAPVVVHVHPARVNPGKETKKALAVALGAVQHPRNPPSSLRLAS